MYPSYLLPDKSYYLLTDIDSISHHYLGKFVDTEEELLFADGKFNRSFIEDRRIPGFSMNKLPDSIQINLNIKLHPDFAHHNDEWSPGEPPSVPAEEEYEIVENRKHYFFEVSNIHNYTDKYNHPTDKSKPEYEFTVEVVHKPTKCNYWHFELHLSSPDHKLMEHKKWRKAIHSAIADRISNYAKVSLSEHLDANTPERDAQII